MKSLIVEDEKFEREGMKFFLGDYTDADTAANGRAAVEMFTRALEAGFPYQLVLLDILMPVMNGLDALKQMRKLEQETGAAQKAVIIMVTASNSQKDMEEAIWQGDSNDYLVKPVIRADLVAMLRRHGLVA